MKILIDQNISFRLIPRIQDSFPEISHVRDFGLLNFNDFKIFMFAREHRFSAILTLDEDFYNIQLEHGTPPKVIWVRTGNCSTASLASVLLQNLDLIQSFLEDAGLDCLELF